MRYLLTHLLIIAILIGCLTLSSGAFTRRWPRIIAGAGLIGLALAAGNYFI